MIDSLKRVGPSDADVVKVKEQIMRTRETSTKTNGYWLSNISARDQAGEPLAGLLTPYDEMVKAISAQSIKAAAQKYFNDKRYVKVVLLPEGPKP
jgi:zinc protease